MNQLQEKVGYEQRRARARRMHNITRKLVRQKKLLASKYASQDRLHNRAQKLARQLLRKKLAGSRGANYSKLSTTQRIEIDKMIDSLPKSLRKALSSRLIPYVTKAETKRITKYKSRRKLREAVEKNLEVPKEQGTPELTQRYKDMTPGQKTVDTIKKVVSEAIRSGARPLMRRTRILGRVQKRKVTKTVPGQKGGLTAVSTKRVEQGKRMLSKRRSQGTQRVIRTAQQTAKNIKGTVLRSRESIRRSQRIQQIRRKYNPN